MRAGYEGPPVLFLVARLFGGLFLGWGIGANNSADIFGTAVATHSIRFRTAIILIAIFAMTGAIVEGHRLYAEYHFSGDITENLAFAATLGAALTICALTWLSLPASASQAAVGGVMGISIWVSGIGGADWSKLGIWACCWVVNPLISGTLAALMMRFIGPFVQRRVKNLMLLNLIYKIGFLVIGCYAAYTLGGNNVVVTTGPFFQAGIFGDPALARASFIAAAIGGASIAVGAATYARKVMYTVGHGITTLDPFSALVVVLAHALVLHMSTQLHIPVSSAQATVGAVAGVGLTKGMQMVNSRTLALIFCGWIMTPAVSAVLAIGLAAALHA